MATTTTDLLDRLLLVTSLLADDQARFERAHGLTGPRVHVLWHLGITGPVRQADLAAALAVSPRNITGLVDGLVSSGHVRRDPHPGDRRAFLVALTGEGKGFVASLQRQHRELAGALFGDLTPGARGDLLAQLELTAARLSELLAQEPAR